LKYNDNDNPIVKKRKKKSKQHKKRLDKLQQMRDNLKSGSEVARTVAYKAPEIIEKNSSTFDSKVLTGESQKSAQIKNESFVFQLV
jgi:hypothetical protein